MNQPSTKRILLLHNKKAGAKRRAKRVDALYDALQEHGFVVLSTNSLDEYQQLAGAPEENYHAIVAAGGDGTAAEAVNRSPPNTPIALFPLGTENLAARYLKQPKEAGEFAKMVSTRKQVHLDVGKANGRLFLLMIGVGFDAEVVRHLAENRGGHITRWTYAKPLWQTIRQYRYPELLLRCKNFNTASDQAGRMSQKKEEQLRTTQQFTAKWVFGMNLPKYALNLQFAPDANGQDGLLDVCMFENGSFSSGLKYFANLVLHRHPKLKDTTLFRCHHMTIESRAGETVPYQLDGDPGGYLPVEVEIEPARFTAIVTAERASELNGQER